MHEPSVRGSRLAIAAGLVAILLVGGVGFLAGRETAPAERIVVTPAPPPLKPSTGIAIVPSDQSIWGREQLLDLVHQASDAAASDIPLPEKVARAAGKRFTLVLPFGCAGPSAQGGTNALGWGFDEDDSVLRVYASPLRWTMAEWGLGSSAGEALMGFWIPRPWSSSTDCPARVGHAGATDSDPVTLPGQSLAISQKIPTDREWRAFEKVERAKRDELETGAGFRLRLTGRLDGFRDAGPVKCIQPAGPEQRPLCMLGARFEEVRIENAATGEVLGVWDERALQR